MDDLPLQDVPRDGEIVEVLYRLSRTAPTYLDMTVSTPRALRRLRFTRPRVVQFRSELPDVLRGLEVQDIRDQRIGDLALWVSVADGAVTFWAKGVSEITTQRAELGAVSHATPLVEADDVRAWGPIGLPQTSFRYRTPGRGGALRHFSISTRPYVRA